MTKKVESRTGRTGQLWTKKFMLKLIHRLQLMVLHVAAYMIDTLTKEMLTTVAEMTAKLKTDDS
jgi:hypothetical protein